MKADSLKECIATFEQLREAHSSRLDPRVRLDLEDVIDRLKRLAENEQGDVVLGTVALDALQVLNQVVLLVTNITNFMTR